MIDVGNSAFATTILAALFPVYLPSLVPPEGVTLSVFGASWQTSAISLWGYAVSFSLILTLLMAPIIGAWADENALRKKLLGIFTFLGAGASVALGFCDTWKSALVCFVVANIGFSASNIFYNSLISSVAEEKEWHSLSLKGFAWGYIGGGVLLAINLLMIQRFEWFAFESKKAAVEASFMSVGIWWAAFTVPSLLLIREYSAPRNTEIGEGILRQLHIIWHTLKKVIKNKVLLLFMISFAFFNDGIQTVISMASIFGKEALQLDEGTLIGTLLMIQILGLPFTLGMTKLADRWGAKETLMGSLFFWLFIVAYAYFMETAKDFWMLGLMVAIVLGVSQALGRSIYASLIPKDRQAEYFAFFAISGKMTSIVGPTLFAAVKDATGNVRLSIVALGLMFVAGIVALCFVRLPRPNRK